MPHAYVCQEVHEIALLTENLKKITRRNGPELGGHICVQTWQLNGMLGRYTQELSLSSLGIYYMSAVHTRWRRSRKENHMSQYILKRIAGRSGVGLHTNLQC
uniref:Uncharacterized protein n=1 Tax=Triticum urartu TaxID=4572 RepID=A0A8R7PEJ6_TRIUA